MANGEGRRPDFKVFVTREGNEKSFFMEIGAGWKVGNDGISLRLHALPANGECVMFPPREEREEPAAPAPPVKRK